MSIYLNDNGCSDEELPGKTLLLETLQLFAIRQDKILYHVDCFPILESLSLVVRHFVLSPSNKNHPGGHSLLLLKNDISILAVALLNQNA